ncbi:glycosyl hydrolase 5 family protein-like [Humulus lupulus]|uniref:glycosyl hydrolase 5 family protein-like n=1 Tax=Humulus lupulus TaxID=3486 RepID=UPI002B401F3F|nr:glycosyl hydrolase 5 family protein-like [Humulus lupulus]
MKMGRSFLLHFLSVLTFTTFFLVSQTGPATGLPLATNSRWIVNEISGKRVKLACVNWVSHLEVVLAEGLNKQPIDAIVGRISSMGFNCVRLTWPVYLATNNSLASLTVRQSFQRFGLAEAIAGIEANNPSIIDIPLIKAYQAVVAGLGKGKVMVILDNHVSNPSWCCHNTDGNGFFGDKYFDPEQWIEGLTRMATLFKGHRNVVGMSLRNELRGPRQNEDDWYKYMQRGAEAVHSANPNVLVIISGLHFDTHLSYLRNRAFRLTFSGKLVFEVHWYSFIDGKAWESENANKVCGWVGDNMKTQSGFLVKKGFPLFLSEFGVDERGTNENDNRYLNCALAVAAELDLDWALWTLAGSYYFREGVVGLDEVYAVLNKDFNGLRNATVLHKITSLRHSFQGPGLSTSRSHKVIFHPATGDCVVRKSQSGPLALGPCSSSDAWHYSHYENTLTIRGTPFCLRAQEVGKPAQLSKDCTAVDSKWKPISDSNLQLSTTTGKNDTVCLDVDSSANEVVVNACYCVSEDSWCDPSRQWFKLVYSTRKPKAGSFSKMMITPTNDGLAD